jgi:hypothetical protein
MQGSLKLINVQLNHYVSFRTFCLSRSLMLSASKNGYNHFVSALFFAETLPWLKVMFIFLFMLPTSAPTTQSSHSSLDDSSQMFSYIDLFIPRLDLPPLLQ